MIVPDGRTATRLDVQGSKTDITTGTVNAGIGFNSFSQFQVGAGNTANLHLAPGTDHLVNIVRNGPAVVDGILNGYREGRIDGHVVFASPQGFVVGASGTVNVGALTVVTPPADYLDRAVGPNGAVDPALAQQLVTGSTPISPGGLVAVRGKINAPGGARLKGKRVEVAGSVKTGPQAALDPAFVAAVNTQGLAAGAGIVERNGAIEIVAEDDVALSGHLAADGGTGPAGAVHAAREVKITAGRDIAVAGTAAVTANANRDGATGGTVNLYARRDSKVEAGARIEAKGGRGGRGGFIEVSAAKTSELAGGSFDASAAGGTAGAVLFDPADLTVSRSIAVAGDVTLTADNSIVVAPGVTISSRNAVNGQSVGNSGTISLTAPNIRVSAGALLDASANNGFAGGDIRLIARSAGEAQMGRLTSATNISVAGTLRGANITLSAISTVKVEHTDGNLMLSGEAIGGDMPGLTAGLLAGQGSAGVSILGGAVISGTGNVTLEAANVVSVKEKAYNDEGSPVNVTALYGEAMASAETRIRAGATVGAGGTLTVRAANAVNLTVKAVSESSNESSYVDVTLAIGKADVRASAVIDSGASLSAGALNLLARNDGSFSVESNARAYDKGSIGMAAAMQYIDTDATAHLGASLTGASTVIVDAATTIKGLSTSAGTSAGTSSLGIFGTLGGDKARERIKGKFDQFQDAKDAVGTEGGDLSSPIKLGSAMALTVANQTVRADIEADPGYAAPSVAASKAIAVTGRLTVQGIHNKADSAAEAKGKDVTATLSAGIATGLYTNTNTAMVGQGVSLAAPVVGVGADTDLPLAVDVADILTWTKWDDFDTIKTRVMSLTDLPKMLTSYASATAQGKAEVNVGGAVNLFSLTNRTTAWVDDGARITTAPFTYDRTTRLETGWDAATGVSTYRTLTWADTVTVQARTAVTTIDIGGNISLSLQGTGGNEEGAAVGGATNIVTHRTTTNAGIGAGVVVDTLGGLWVKADTTNFLLAVSPTAGRGSGIGVNLILGLVTVGDATHASVSSETDIRATRVYVAADQAMNVWNAAGAFSMNKEASVGAAAAVNVLATDTVALVGDNGVYDPTERSAMSSGRRIRTQQLDVRALSDGVSGALAVAGTVTKNSNGSGKPEDDKADVEKKSGIGDKIKGLATSVKDKLVETFPGVVRVASEISAAIPSDPGGEPKPSDAQFGLAISGSGTVLLSAMNTRASVDGALVEKEEPWLKTNVQAVNNSFLLSLAGAGALTWSKSTSSQLNAAVAGAMAMSLSDNHTDAAITNSRIEKADSVLVQALNGGMNISIGLGLAVNNSSGESNLSGAGSVSVSLVRDTARAIIDGSTITGDPGNHANIDGAPGDYVNVTAYQRTDIGVGGGALFAGGKAGAGLAFTLAIVGDGIDAYGDPLNAAEAAIRSSTISAFDSVTVSALDVRRIGAGAAMGSAITENSAAGAFAHVDSAATNLAEIRESSVQATGAIAVLADGTASATLDHALAQDGKLATSADAFDFAGKTVDKNGLGSTIVSVAGVVQQGQNNVGLAYAGTSVRNRHSASIVTSTVTSSGGAVTVDARDSTLIVAAGMGAAVAQGSFAGLGTMTFNLVQNETTARIGSGFTEPGATVVAGTQVAARAKDATIIASTSGNVGYGGSIALGGAFSVNVLGSATVAEMARTIVTPGAGGLSVLADSSSQIWAAAIQGAFSKETALSGSGTGNNISNRLEATIRDVVADAPAANATVKVTDSSSIRSAAGAAAFSLNTAAVGAGLAVNRLGNTLAATVRGPDTNLAVRNLLVDAETRTEITTVAVGVAGTNMAAVAGSVATSILNTSVTAAIREGAVVTAENNVGVTASSIDRLDASGGGAGVALQYFGMGIGTAVNVVTGSTKAVIAEGATVTGKGQEPGDLLTVFDGGLTTALDLSRLDKTADTASRYAVTKMEGSTKKVGGVAVNAVSLQQVGSSAGSVGLAFNLIGSAALAASVSTNVLAGETLAQVDDSTVRGSNLDVLAGSQTYAASMVQGVAGGAGFSAAGAMQSTAFNRKTSATVTNSNVEVGGAAGIGATAAQASVAFNMGASVSLGGIAAGAIVTVFDALTEAYAGGSLIAADRIAINATSRNGLTAMGDTLSIGGIGVGGTLAVTHSTNRTHAYADAKDGNGMTLNARSLDIRADGDNHFLVQAVSASGGASAVAAMASVLYAGNETRAGLYNAWVYGAAPSSDVTVKAHDTLDVKAWAGALAVGGGSSVGVGANIVVGKSDVAAEIDGATLTDGIGAVTVTAQSDRSADVITLGGALDVDAGIGGSAALVLFGLGSAGDAYKVLDKDGQGTLTKAGGLSDTTALTTNNRSLSAQEKADIDARSHRNVAAAVTSGKANTTKARFDNSTLVGSGLYVSATDRTSTRNIVGGVGVGLSVGVGGAVGVTRVYNDVTAQSVGSSVLATTVDIRAGAGNLGDHAVDVIGIAGALGSVALGAAYADAAIDNRVTASLDAATGTGAGAVSVAAADDSTVSSKTYGAQLGLTAAGLSIARAGKDSAVQASVGGGSSRSVTGFNTLTVDAGESGAVIAESIAAAGGIGLSVTGSAAEARDRGKVAALIAADTAVVTGGAVSLHAHAAPDVRSHAIGANLSKVGMGASVALASLETQVTAATGDRSTITTPGAVTIAASAAPVSGRDSAHAEAYGGVGGLLLGANATDATARNSSAVRATTGTGSSITHGGLSVTATNTAVQTAKGLGVTVGGLLALGANLSTAESEMVTEVTLGTGSYRAVTGADGAVRAGTAVLLSAVGASTSIAESVAGTGGLIAGSASVATVKDDSRALTTIAGGSRKPDASPATLVEGSGVTAAAAHTATYRGHANSVQAAVAGMSGSLVENTLTADVGVVLGDNVRLYATRDAMVLDSRASVIQNNPLDRDGTPVSNAEGGAGGVVTGAAVASRTALNTQSRVEVGQGDELWAFGGAVLNGGKPLDINASTILSIADRAKLVTGGLIQMPEVSSTLTGSVSNAVSIGAGAHLNAIGNIGIGAYVDGTVTASALGKTYGLAGAISGTAKIGLTASQSVVVGPDADIWSWENASLAAGGRGDGSTGNRLHIAAYTDIYNGTPFAVKTDPYAESVVSSLNTMLLDERSKVRAVRDVRLTADQGDTDVYGSGNGTNPWLDLFGQKISDSKALLTATARMALRGVVDAGVLYDQSLVIDEAPNDPTRVVLTNGTNGWQAFATSGGVVDTDLRQRLQAFLTANPGQAAFYDHLLAGLPADQPYRAVVVSGLRAAPGNIVLRTSAMSDESRATLTAHGAPSIRIVNNSRHNLLLDGVHIADGSGGQVLFAGPLRRTGAPAGLTIVEDGKNQLPSVTILNTYDRTDAAPLLGLLGSVSNAHGAVTLENKSGDILQMGGMSALSLSVSAPRGSFTQRVDGIYQLGGVNLTQVVATDLANVGDLANLTRSLSILYQSSASRALDTPAFLAGSGLVTAGKVAIVADIIDVAGRIVSQQTYNYAVQFDRNDSALMATMNAARSAWLAGTGPRYTDITGTVLNGAALATAQYDAASDRILLKDIVSSTRSGGLPTANSVSTPGGTVRTVSLVGGGSVYLEGKIVNTLGSTFGPSGIEVQAGYGNLEVRNTTGRELVLGGIDVGGASTGRVTLVDRLKTDQQGRPLISMYEFTAGQGRTDYVGYDPARLTPVPVAGDTQQTRNLVYNPMAGAGFHYTYSAVAEVYRSGPELNDASVRWVSPWTKTFGPDLAVFTDPLGNSASALSQTHRTPGNGVDPIKYGLVDLQFWRRVGADAPINIRFTGNAAGNVTINSDANLIVGGDIRNGGGTTALSSSLGNVTSINNATITSQALAITAEKGVGLPGAALTVELTGNRLSAVAREGDIDLTVKAASLSAQIDAQTGNVRLTSNGEITGHDRAASGWGYDIHGRAVSLTTTGGGIGTGAAPLALLATERLDARATNGITLTQVQGDLKAGSIVSTGGDVKVVALNGSVTDANPVQIDVENQKRLAQVWKALNLTENRTETETVAAYQNHVKAQYQEYWNIRSVAYSGGHFDLTGRAHFFKTQAAGALGKSNPTDAEIAAWVQARYAELTGFFQQEVFEGAPLPAAFTTYDANWTYTLDHGSARYAAMTAGAQWKQSQLLYAVDAKAVTPVTGTSVRRGEPNLSGDNVTISAAQGAIGSPGAPVVIHVPVSGDFTITDAQAAALAGAAPGELTTVENADHSHTITIDSPNPLFVNATGLLRATALRDIVLSAPGTIRTDGITSTGNGDVKLTAGNGIQQVGTTDSISGSRIKLDGGSGSIGSLDNPLLVTGVSGWVDLATAAGDIAIARRTGDLVIGNAYAGGKLQLDARAGSILSEFDTSREAIHLQADSIDLTAANAIGDWTWRLSVGLGNGVLNARATRDVFIQSFADTLRIGNASTDMTLVLGAAKDMTVTGTITAPNVALDVKRALSLEAGAAITNTVHPLVIKAGSLSMAGGSRISSVQGVGLALSGGATIGQEGAPAATITAAGALDIGSGSGVVTLRGAGTTLKSTGNRVSMTLAGFDQGEGTAILARDSLTVTGTGGMALNGAMTGGDVTLAANTLSGTGALSAAGLLSLTSGGDARLTGGSLTAATVRLRSTGGAFDTGLATVSGTTVRIDAATALRVGGAVKASGAVTLAGDSLALDAAVTGATIGATAAGNGVVRGNLSGTNGVTLSAGGDLVVDTGIEVSSASGDVALSGRYLRLNHGSRVAGGTLTLTTTGTGANLGEGLGPVTLSARGAATLSFAGLTGLDGSITTGGGLMLTAAGGFGTADRSVLQSRSGDVSVTAASLALTGSTLSGKAVTLRGTAGDVALGSSTIQGETVVLEAKGALSSAGTVGATGQATLTAGGTLSTAAGAKVTGGSGDLTLSGASLTLGGDHAGRVVTLRGTSGAVTLDGTLTAATLDARAVGALTARRALAVGGAASLQGASVTLAGLSAATATIQATGAVTLAGAVAGTQGVTVSTTGDLVVDTGIEVSSASGDVALSGRYLRLNHGSRVAGGALTLTTTGAGANLGEGLGPVTLSARGAATLSFAGAAGLDGSLTAGDGLTLTAAGSFGTADRSVLQSRSGDVSVTAASLALTGSTLSGKAVTLRGTAGDVALGSSAVQGETVALEAKGALSSTGTVGATGQATLTAGSMALGGTVTGGNGVSLTAGDVLSTAAGAKVTGGSGDLTLSGASLTLGGDHAGRVVTLRGTSGAVTLDGTLTAATLDARAVGALTARRALAVGGAASLQGASVTLAGLSAATATIQATGAVTLAGAVAGTQGVTVSTTGDLVVDTGGEVSSASGDVALSGRYLRLNHGSRVAGGALTLTTTGAGANLGEGLGPVTLSARGAATLNFAGAAGLDGSLTAGDGLTLTAAGSFGMADKSVLQSRSGAVLVTARSMALGGGTVSGYRVTLRGTAGDVALGSSTVQGDLMVTVEAKGALSSTGTVSTTNLLAQTGGSLIALTGGSLALGGTVSGARVSATATDAVALTGAITGSISVNVTAGSTVTGAGGTAITGGSTVTVRGGSLALDGGLEAKTITLGSTSGDVTLGGTLTATTLTARAAGALTAHRALAVGGTATLQGASVTLAGLSATTAAIQATGPVAPAGARVVRIAGLAAATLDLSGGVVTIDAARVTRATINADRLRINDMEVGDGVILRSGDIVATLRQAAGAAADGRDLSLHIDGLDRGAGSAAMRITAVAVAGELSRLRTVVFDTTAARVRFQNSDVAGTMRLNAAGVGLWMDNADGTPVAVDRQYHAPNGMFDLAVDNGAVTTTAARIVRPAPSPAPVESGRTSAVPPADLGSLASRMVSSATAAAAIPSDTPAGTRPAFAPGGAPGAFFNAGLPAGGPAAPVVSLAAGTTLGVNLGGLEYGRPGAGAAGQEPGAGRSVAAPGQDQGMQPSARQPEEPAAGVMTGGSANGNGEKRRTAAETSQPDADRESSAGNSSNPKSERDGV
ncbi:leukotoxin LktA family filamentous adhesin [Azospirillum thermophilum]|uniref:leukotoxin LktA family filamentous adhesin n=1 Tax=Azospirillum thermophilum TaxID=2202148 RepID=UPI00143DB1EE|nr:leukotoxin LktA family filamentous adhesin [Azospirillum thermophilum]